MSETINIYECDREVVIILQGANVMYSLFLKSRFHIHSGKRSFFRTPRTFAHHISSFTNVLFVCLYEWTFFLFFSSHFFRIKIELQSVITQYESIIFEMLPLLLLSAINNVYTISHIRWFIESYNWLWLILAPCKSLPRPMSTLHFSVFRV